MTVASTQIDRSAIQIRPYEPKDESQVHTILVQGFKPVGERYFQRSMFHRTTQSFTIAISTLNTALLYFWVLPWMNDTPKVSPFSFYWIFLSTLLAIEIIGLKILQWYCLSQTDDYIKECFQEDLSSIQGYYQGQLFRPKENQPEKEKNLSQFFVACLKTHPDLILGCIAMDHVSYHADHLLKKHIKEHSGSATVPPFQKPDISEVELRRMSVHRDYRRLGISKMLLVQLTKDAIEKGFKTVTLSTTDVQVEAIEGYTKFGFKNTKKVKMSDLLSVWYGALDLEKYQQKKK